MIVKRCIKEKSKRKIFWEVKGSHEYKFTYGALLKIIGKKICVKQNQWLQCHIFIVKDTGSIHPSIHPCILQAFGCRAWRQALWNVYWRVRYSPSLRDTLISDRNSHSLVSGHKEVDWTQFWVQLEMMTYPIMCIFAYPYSQLILPRLLASGYLI